MCLENLLTCGFARSEGNLQDLEFKKKKSKQLFPIPASRLLDETHIVRFRLPTKSTNNIWPVCQENCDYGISTDGSCHERVKNGWMMADKLNCFFHMRSALVYKSRGVRLIIFMTSQLYFLSSCFYWWDESKAWPRWTMMCQPLQPTFVVYESSTANYCTSNKKVHCNVYI